MFFFRSYYSNDKTVNENEFPTKLSESFHLSDDV